MFYKNINSSEKFVINEISYANVTKGLANINSISIEKHDRI